MALAAGWLTGEDQIRALLREAHRARHNAGREETRLRKAEIERLRRVGGEKRAAALDERQWKKGIAFARRKRRREEIEEKQASKRIRVVVPDDDRLRKVRTCPASLFHQFEAKKSSADGGLRDLYYDVISRGLSSGQTKDYKRHLKRSSARTTRWKPGEMGRKVGYIIRPDALEQVEDNIQTNMGETIEEAVACTRALEQIEKMNRDNAGVYKHVIIGLPHHLSAKGRAEILAELTKPLREMSLPFVATLHNPDKRGDQRNFHAHIIVSLRPMVRLGDHQWEFEAVKRTWLDTPGAIRLQRRFVAGVFNRALDAADESVRWTGRSRAARGEKSPGNTKQSQEGNRARRQDQEVESALSVALDNVAAIETLSDDLSALHSSFGDLARISHRFDQVAGQALGEVSALRAAAATQVSTLERLAALHAGLSPHVGQVINAAEQAGPVEIRTSGPLCVGVPKPDEGRSRQSTPPHEELPTDSIASTAKERSIAPDVFAELSRFQLEQDQKSQKRHASPATKLKPFMTQFELAEAAARFEMNDMWDCVDSEAFARVGQALRGNPAALTAEPIDDGDFQLFAVSADLLRDVETMCRSDAGRVYFRLVLEEAPPPPADKRGLCGVCLRRQKSIGGQRGGAASRAMQGSTASPEENVAIDVQAALLARAGLAR